ncbi:hypothetical protein [Streptosporangium canum]
MQAAAGLGDHRGDGAVQLGGERAEPVEGGGQIGGGVAAELLPTA